MKFYAAILSLLLLVLSGLPCADMGDNNGAQEISSSISENHTHGPKEKHVDMCSPFCSCNCCGLQILDLAPSTSFDVVAVKVGISTPETTYKSNLASVFSGSIWQPPQIV